MSEQQPGYGISKTVPKREGEQTLLQLYDGSIPRFEFHMSGSMKKVAVGDWVYTIYGDELRGRCRIVELITGQQNPCSGKPMTLVAVSCPGEVLAEPVPMKGHQGTRYCDGQIWPG